MILRKRRTALEHILNQRMIRVFIVSSTVGAALFASYIPSLANNFLLRIFLDCVAISVLTSLVLFAFRGRGHKKNKED